MQKSPDILVRVVNPLTHPDANRQIVMPRRIAPVCLRHDDGNVLTKVLSVNKEMRVERENAGAGIQLGKPDEASVSQRHRQIFVLVDEFPERLPLPQHGEIDLE